MDDPLKPAPVAPPLTATPAVSSPADTPALKGPGSVPQLDALFGVAGNTAGGNVIALPVVENSFGLEKIVTVEEAIPVIGDMMRAERAATNPGKRLYPRRLLRQQHIVAFMLVNPFAATHEICNFFQISPSTFYNICKSDTFKALVNQHRVCLDMGIGGDLQDQMKETLQTAVGVVQKGLVEKQDPDFALQTLDKVANRLGMGVKHTSNPTQVNINIVTPEMVNAARAALRSR